MSHRIVLIGAGNLATHLASGLKEAGYRIVQVFSRTREAAEVLAARIECAYTTIPEEITSDSDLLFVVLSDGAFQDVLPRIEIGNRFLIHCSGSMPLKSLAGYSENIGVLYPLQTFSRNHPVLFRSIPLFVEANTKANENILIRLAGDLSDNVMALDSESRLFLHIAAVFACNFVNHFYARAAEVLEIKRIPFELIRPLILETARKVQSAHPPDVQTGPAVRSDQNVINLHLEALRETPELFSLYRVLSESVINYSKIK